MASRRFLYFRVPGRWGEETLWAPGPLLLDPLTEGKINDWAPEWQPIVRLLRSKKPVPNPLPFDLLPPEWRMMTVNRKPLPFEKDLAITNFIEERMPEGRKRKGVPKGLIEDAKTKFGLKSKSAVLRAFSRGKKEKKLHGLKLHGLLSKSATPEGSA